jgi:hypothetical protein
MASPSPTASPAPPTISTDTQPISVPINFSFQNVLEYSDCLEDIIQLYQNPEQLKQRGRRSDCLPEVFSSYATAGLSQSQARELIEAANQYAINAEAGRWLFPPGGLRTRIRQMFGFSYEIDTQR